MFYAYVMDSDVSYVHILADHITEEGMCARGIGGGGGGLDEWMGEWA
jgi:hypothetical protein